MAFTTVTGSNGVTSLVGTSGIDVATIVTLTSNVFVGAQGADDTINQNSAGPTFAASNWTVNGGSGNDTVTFVDVVLNSIINGDGGTGTAGNDLININSVSGAIGSSISGGSGNDVIGTTGGGSAAFSGSTVNGNAGDDTIRVGASSASYIYGGQDVDTITTAGAITTTLINGNKGSDTLTLGAFSFENGSVYGGNGTDTITAAAVTAAGGGAISATAAGVFISGDLGNDNITGSGAVDTIQGGDGADTVAGGAGGDTISTGADNDLITGGAGADTISGGAGNNTFGDYSVAVATVAAGANTGFDSITDFVANTTLTGGLPTNGSVIDIGVAATGLTVAASVASDTGADLATILTTNFGGMAASTGAVGIITITAGASNAGIAGNYLVVNNGGTAGWTAGADNVIKLNTLSNITAANLANVIGNF